MRYSTALLSLLAIASFTGSADAAVVDSWTYQTLTSADSIAPTAGQTLVAAFNKGGSAGTLGGVSFVAAGAGAFTTSNGITVAFSAPGVAWGTAASGAFPSNSVLNTFEYTSQSNGTLEFSGLTIGQSYVFEFIIADTRAGPDGRQSQIVGSTVNGATITGSSSLYRYAYVGEDKYALISAAFTADSAKAAFTCQNFNSTGVTQGAQINAIQILAVPEPSTYGLMGAGALAAVTAVRRRRKAV